jgi:hypothetical protein
VSLATIAVLAALLASGDPPPGAHPREVGEPRASDAEGQGAATAGGKSARDAAAEGARREAPPDPDAEVVRNLDVLQNLDLLEHLELLDPGEERGAASPSSGPRPPPPRPSSPPEPRR